MASWGWAIRLPVQYIPATPERRVPASHERRSRHSHPAYGHVSDGTRFERRRLPRCVKNCLPKSPLDPGHAVCRRQTASILQAGASMLHSSLMTPSLDSTDTRGPSCVSAAQSDAGFGAWLLQQSCSCRVPIHKLPAKHAQKGHMLADPSWLRQHLDGKGRDERGRGFH